MASSKPATMSVLRPSRLMFSSVPRMAAIFAPDDWPYTSEAHAHKAREAPREALRVAPASPATAVTPDAVRTAMEAAAPPKPVKQIISDCATCARKRFPSIQRVAASFRLLSRTAFFCAVTVDRTLEGSGVTRAAISPMSWSTRLLWHGSADDYLIKIVRLVAGHVAHFTQNGAESHSLFWVLVLWESAFLTYSRNFSQTSTKEWRMTRDLY